MVQLNPAFVPGGDIGQLVAEGLLQPECERIFRGGKTGGAPGKGPWALIGFASRCNTFRADKNKQ
jgi:hypothetical protein